VLLDADTLAFVGIAAIVVVTPGPDMVLVTAHALGRGRRSALLAALGVNTGILVHASGAAVGISAVLAASSLAFTAVKLVGGAFLVFLGARALLGSIRGPERSLVAEPMPSMRIGASPYWQGFWSNVLNPKVALLFLSLLPQFVEQGDPVLAKTLLLSGLFLAMGIGWLLAYAALVSRIAGVFRSARLRRRLEGITGAILVALGLRIAVQDA
jgi:threonine/homoserine/homoserine lactone efflux protein